MSGTDTRIREAAITLFATNGFAGTGIRELADRVGVTTSSLYHHISSKDDLLEQIVTTSMAALNDVGDYWFNQQAAPPKRFAGLVACHAIIHTIAANETIVVDRQLAAMQPSSRRRAVAARDKYERTWRDLIVAGVESGAFRVDHPELATRALLGATTAIADWYRPRGAIESDKLAEAYTAMAFDLLNAAARPDIPDLTEAMKIFTTRWDTT